MVVLQMTQGDWLIMIAMIVYGAVFFMLGLFTGWSGDV